MIKIYTYISLDTACSFPALPPAHAQAASRVACVIEAMETHEWDEGSADWLHEPPIEVEVEVAVEEESAAS